MNKMNNIHAKTELKFVTEVAEDCIKNMTEEDKHYMRLHPCVIEYHFTYGMYIRNHYIYNQDFSKLNFICNPDNLSMKILEMIISKLIPEYKYGHSFYEILYNDKEFLDLREHYWNLHQKFPDDHIENFLNYLRQECSERKTYPEEELIRDCKKQLAERLEKES